MSLWAIAARVLFAYVFLVIVTRMSGKRTVGQATPLDFIAALIVGDLVDDLTWGEVSAAKFVVAAGVLFLTHIGISLLPAQKLINGQLTTVVQQGALVREGMRAERTDEQDVEGLLRTHSLDDLREVECGTLEVSGKLGLVRRQWAKPAQKQDLPRVRKAAG